MTKHMKIALSILVTAAMVVSASIGYQLVEVRNNPAPAPWSQETYDAPRYKRSPEIWYVAFGPEFTKMLAERPATIDNVDLGPMVRVDKMAGVPALNGKRIRSAMRREFVRLWANLPIELREIVTFDGVTRAKRKIVLHDRHPYLLGTANRIDPLNRLHRETVDLYFGELIETLREHSPRNLFGVRRAPTEDEIGSALAILITHEIGHTLGCRHNANESPEDKLCIMTPGVAKYLPQNRKEVRWHYQQKVYLWGIMIVQPWRRAIPTWCNPKYDH